MTSLNSKESILGFVYWLSLQDIPFTVSNTHSLDHWISLINEFADTNNLPCIRSGWQQLYEYPTLNLKTLGNPSLVVQTIVKYKEIKRKTLKFLQEKIK